MAKQTFTTGQVLTAAQMTSLQQTAMGGGSTTAKTTSYVLTAADAGTVVAMNAAGATTITVNTGLFSAGDTVFIQNWGAGTCTVTAGTATVTTHGSLALGQWEGGTLYFTSASAAIFFDISQTSGMTNPMTTTGDMIYSSSGSTPARLGLGTANQQLRVNAGATAPEWFTPAAGGGGKVLQVVQGVTTTTKSISSTTFTDTNLTATITPSATTSKVLIIISQHTYIYSNSTSQACGLRLLRGATDIYNLSDGAAGRTLEFNNANSYLNMMTVTNGTYLDSPATTSATTYKTQGNSQNVGAGKGVDFQVSNVPSTITLLEIGA